MSRKYKPLGKGTSVCTVAAMLMVGNHTRSGIAAALCADRISVAHSLELLRRHGLAYKSHADLSREVLADGTYRRGPYPIVWAWNKVPFQYGDFCGPESNQKGNVMPLAEHKPKPLNAKHKRLIEMAYRPCGVTSRQFAIDQKIEQQAAASAFTSATRASRVVCVVHPADAKKVNRYFTSRSLANVWLAGPPPESGPVLIAIGARIKSTARQPGPQIKREKAPPEHAWRPDAHTACASKMASVAPSEALPPTSVGPSPKLWGAPRYAVDPATVPRTFSGPLGCDPMTGRAWGT